MKIMASMALVWALLLGAGCAGSKAGAGGGSGLGGGEAIREVVGKVDSVLGNAWLKQAGEREWVPLAAGDALSKGALLRTGPGANLEFSLRDGSRAELMSDSSLLIQENLIGDDGLSLYLGGGRVRGMYAGSQLDLLTACGSSIELTPKAGASVPFDISNRSPTSGGLFLGVGSDGAWSPSMLPSDLPLVIRSSVAPNVPISDVPEPGVGALVCVGALGLLGSGWAGIRARCQSGPSKLRHDDPEG